MGAHVKRDKDKIRGYKRNRERRFRLLEISVLKSSFSFKDIMCFAAQPGNCI